MYGNQNTQTPKIVVVYNGIKRYKTIQKDI